MSGLHNGPEEGQQQQHQEDRQEDRQLGEQRPSRGLDPIRIPEVLDRDPPEKMDKSREMKYQPGEKEYIEKVKGWKDEKELEKDLPGASPAHLSLSLNQLHLKIASAIVKN